MIKTKPLIVLLSILFVVTLIIPAVLVLPFSEGKSSGKLGETLTHAPSKNVNAVPTADAGVEVAVYRFSKSKIENIPLENYLVGVVAAEMPAEFGDEALKAQALTARTYIVKQMLSKDHPELPKGAVVGDTVINQVYNSDDELKKIWGIDYSWKKEKILKAVRATSGQIITYKGQVISAMFFSTSNGYTENSEDYWPNSFPYLRSVASPWDKESPKFNNQKILSVQEFETKLGVKLSGSTTIGKITDRTAGKRVGEVNIKGKVLTGREIRERLDLKSSDFSWVRKGNNIIISTRGYGHGVGMSQYGANGMASEGDNYQEIIKHYYQGVDITSAETMLATITARK
ncbi:stage II sporulation protein D [Neobacillus sp. PS3-40]|uniref:stage II sporulation protein D n=1 Tax=Neobacillus sp. PS3-40 TaxID=3070679 RepID=UPI0027E1334D|nr:stage II sporulation protein D [Neobacillus sp. PS3-40]WML46221.1 stage II sporulation protein D [Neobacillus sp. PS3-40]